jgi:hypothetical protein
VEGTLRTLEYFIYNIIKLYKKFKNIVKFSVLYCSGDLLVGKDIYIALEYL